MEMAITGHRTDSMLRRYSTTTSNDKRAAKQTQIEHFKAQPNRNNVAEFRTSGSESDSDNARAKGIGDDTTRFDSRSASGIQ
jgi:hypothetical protein